MSQWPPCQMRKMSQLLPNSQVRRSQVRSQSRCLYRGQCGPGQLCQGYQQKNPRNKNIDQTVKTNMRELFINKMIAANNLPADEYPTVCDIESVLIFNNFPKRVTENRNLYKFFGKGSVRAPSKEVYIAMKSAVESNTLKTAKSWAARLVATSEIQKIHSAVDKLIEKKTNEQAASTVSKPAARRLKIVKPVVPSGNFFTHGLKLHTCSLFYEDELQTYDSDAGDEDRDAPRGTGGGEVFSASYFPGHGPCLLPEAREYGYRGTYNGSQEIVGIIPEAFCLTCRT